MEIIKRINILIETKRNNSSSLHPDDQNKNTKPIPNKIMVDLRIATSKLKEKFENISNCFYASKNLENELKDLGYSVNKGTSPPTNKEVSVPYTLGHHFVRVGDWIADIWTREGDIELKVWHINNKSIVSNRSYLHSFNERKLDNYS